MVTQKFWIYEVEHGERNTEMEQGRGLLPWILRLQGAVLLCLTMDVTGEMISIDLIPQYPLINGSVTLSLTGITENIEYVSWHKGLSTDPQSQILSYFPGSSSPLVTGLLYNPRFSAFHNGSLQIKDLNITDGGDYIVKIQTRTQEDITGTLTVYAPVSAVTLTSNTSGTLWAGQDSVSLLCTAQGPATIFSWRQNGNPVSPSPPYYITNSTQNSTLTISPVSKNDNGPFTCTASSIADSGTSNGLTINVAWLAEGNIICSAHRLFPMLQLGCFWPGGQPAANVTMRFNDVMESKPDQLTTTVYLPDDVIGSNLTCVGDHLRRKSVCILMFEPPQSPEHDNSAVIWRKEGETIVLGVNLTSRGTSQGTSLSLQILPAEFTWFSITSGQTPVWNGEKFTVTSSYYSSSLRISDVTEAESGKYECRAKNFVGSQSFIFTLRMTKEVADSHEGLKGGEIAGIVIGGIIIVGVAIAVLVVLFMMKRKTDNTTGAGNEIADFSPAQTYETKLPGAAIDSAPAIKEESDYQQLVHPEKSLYHIVVPESAK